ncbi:YidH family protein [Jannaschia sp. 2305UL9-9]|uniref:YidH family protein n=1 Tax=Jannaschia sp. 2305UL9-9 TaxID=3121638 RepID=UPI0035284488
MNEQDDDKDKATEWAEHRTNWAEDRTALANERTFAGWMRTGMAAIAIAVGLRAVFREADPTWVPKLVASVFIVAALMIFWSARRQACKASGRLNTHDADTQSTSLFTILSTVFSISAVAVGAVLWTL